MATVLRYLLATIMLLQGAAGIRASEPSLNDQQLNQCLNFAFQQHISGVEDEWDTILIDYAGALPADNFEALAKLTQNQHCLISTDHASFNRANGLHWALALFDGSASTSEITSQLNFEDLNNGEVFLLGYLIATDRFDDTTIQNAAISRLDQLARHNASAALKKVFVTESLSQLEVDGLIQRAVELGSDQALIEHSTVEELQPMLSNKDLVGGLSAHDRSRLIYWVCNDVMMSTIPEEEESSDRKELCKEFTSDPQLLLFQIFRDFNKPYGKDDIIRAKRELLRFLESPEILAGNWLEEFTLYDQAAILLFQLFAHFGDFDEIFSEEDVERYLNLATERKVPLNQHALGYYLASLYQTSHGGDLDERLRQKLEQSFSILNSDNNGFDRCREKKALEFTELDRWPTEPQLPIISTLFLDTIEFLELESAAAEQGKVRIYGEFSQLEPSFLDFENVFNDDRCEFDFVDSGNVVFPTIIQETTTKSTLQREFTSEIYNPEAADIITLTESRLVGVPSGQLVWIFDAHQKTKLETNLRNFPFSTSKTSIEFGFTGRTSYVTFPVLVSRSEVLEHGDLVNEDDGNEFFLRSKDDAKRDINIDAKLYVNLTYYFLRIIAPVLIFVSLGLFTLLKARENTEAQLQVATTVMVALVAYQFVINSTLPKLPYLTLIDMFLLASVASSAFIILFNLVPHLEKKDTRVSEYLFMLSRVGGVGGYAVSAMILIYGLWLYAQS